MGAEELKLLVGTDIQKYTITKYIASGSFGDVFEARDNTTNKLVALKIPIVNEEKNGQKAITAEARIYKRIADPKNGVTDMKVITHKDKKIIVMDLLGPSLEKLMSNQLNKRLGLKSVIALAIQMIETLRYVHTCGFLHRDLKPDNFAVGHHDLRKLYCIDFGLARPFLDKSGEHIPFSTQRKFCGTARYASIAAHKNEEQGRKDDLESIGYILVYLYKGKLPWQSIKHKDKTQRYKLIGDKKEDTSEEELCENMPKEFCVFLKYVRTLDFDEKPHYSALRKMFEKLYEARGYKNDKLEWEDED